MAATLITYATSLENGFVNFDDDRYVFANSHVRHGLTWAGIEWAFRSTDCANWHPLTWLSLELDTTLFGSKAWGYHLTNLLLHCANAVLLFRVLSTMTGAVGRSAVVAAFFAVHPLHVESVTWVAERKDVLCGFFFLLALLAWRRYVSQPSWRRYGVVALALTLGLMAKPMLVTFPFVLLLLDWWPLERRRRQLLVEKLPLLCLVVASCVVTYLVQRHGGAVRSTEQLPLTERLVNTPIAFLAYLVKTFWPARLAVYYPHPEGAASHVEAIAGAVLVSAISALAVWQRRRWPYLFVGWFWWLGMLVPVIGLVQVGTQAYADRYTYLPMIGLLIAFVWYVQELAAARQWTAWLIPGLAASSLLACLLVSHRQMSYWHDGVSLWRHAAEVTTPNPVAFNSLGVALAEQGQAEEAIAWFYKGLALSPDDERCHQNLALALIAMRRLDESLEHFQKVLRIDPGNALAQFNVGVLIERKGQQRAAIEHYRRALAIDPNYWRAHLQLGRALLKNGDTRLGEQHLNEALRSNPNLVRGQPPATSNSQSFLPRD